MNLPKIFWSFFLVLSLLSTPTFAQENTASVFATDDPWVKTIKAKGFLKIGFDTFVPWAMKDKTGGFTGFEIQVAEALAADLGVKAEFIPTAWDGIIPALLTDKFDVLIGGMGITDERAARVAFSDPYEYSGVGLAASLATAPGLTALEDFNKKEITVAVKGGTTASLAAKKLLPEATIVEFDDEGQTAQELKNGRAQALLGGVPFPAALAAKNPKEIYVPIPGTLTKEPIGMALNPKNKAALPALNAWIKVRTDSGWLEKTWQYWFEGVAWEKDLK